MKVKIKAIKKMASGGMLEDSMTPLWGGSANQASHNPNDGGMVQFSGSSHSDGGIGLHYQGNNVEVQGSESASQNADGSLTIWGAMKVPGTNKSFQATAKKIAEEENKANKIGKKGEDIFSDNVDTPFQAIQFNTSGVLQDAANQKLKTLSEQKQQLATTQEEMLQLSDMLGVKPEKLSGKMKMGGRLPRAREGKSLAAKNNNPGNLRYVGQRGATQGEGGFARFDSYEAGLAALKNDLRAKQAGKTVTGLKPSSTLMDLMRVYAPAANNNDPVSYAHTLAKNLGVDVNTPIKDINTDALAGYISQVEDIAYSRQNGNNTPLQRAVATQKVKIASLPQAQPEVPVWSAVGDGLDMAPIGPIQDTKIDERAVENTKFPVVSESPYSINATQQKKKLPSLADRNKIGLAEILPDIAGILEKPTPVAHQRFTPQLYSPYQVSFQDRLNNNASSFKSVEDQLVNNPEALATLAAQKYEADNQVMAEQFRANQQIQNDVTNKNVGILNDAAWKNIGLQGQQYDKKAQAIANTRAHNQQAIADLSSKFAQNRAENNSIRMVENYSNYRLDNDLQAQYMGPEHIFTDGNGMPFLVDNSGKVVTKTKNGNQTITTTSDPTKDQLQEIQLQQAKQKQKSAWFPFKTKR